MNGKPYNRLEAAEAQKIKRNYVCAQCWGELLIDFDKGQPKGSRHKVYCPICGEDRGFVTRDYAIQRKAESSAEANEAARNLGKLLGIEKEPVDREETINQLWPS